MKKIELNGFYTKKELQNKIKELEFMPEIKFKVSDDYLGAFVNNVCVSIMDFIKKDSYSYKIYKLNDMIEKVYSALGCKATMKEIKNNMKKLYGFEYTDIKKDFGIGGFYETHNKINENRISNNEKLTELVYDALMEHRDYIVEAIESEE